VATTNQFAYNALNQLTARPPGLAGATYEWDAEQRLTAINQGNQRLECVYDGRGRRLGLRSLANGLEITNRFFVWSDFETCEERDATGAVVKRFYDQGVQVRTGAAAGTFFYTRDHLESIRELTGTSGSLAARFGYDPYGNKTQSSGAMDADFGFGGHFYENSARLIMTWFRLYDPTVGRWLSRDALKNAELSQGPNLYSFVANNPVSRIDPFGLYDWGWTGIGGMCCNFSGEPEYGLVGDGGWQKIDPGGCTGFFQDCDGLTCGGSFAKVSNLDTASCTPDCEIEGTDWGKWSPGGPDDPKENPSPCDIMGKHPCPGPRGQKWD